MKEGREEGSGHETKKESNQVLGGYVLVTPCQLLMAWWCYSERLIRLKDLRVWLALLEIGKRRDFSGDDRKPRYTLKEIARIVGGGGEETRRLRSSTKRLKNLGLFRIENGELLIPRSPEELKVDDLSGLWEILSLIKGSGRLIPFPRRVLRFLAGGATRAVIATVFAHAIRCLFFSRGTVTAKGWCKASWVTDVFGVSLRSVVSARRHLVEELGWLSEVKTSQSLLNRYGSKVQVNLNWVMSQVGGKKEAEVAVGEGGEQSQESQALPVVSLPEPTPAPEKSSETGSSFAPPPSDICTPINTRTSPSLREEELRNQKLEASPSKPVGVLTSKEEAEEAKTLPAPTLKKILPEDLHDVGRLLELHKEAAERGWVTLSEADELKVIAVAERARTRGTENPAGLFRWLLQNGKFSFVTEDLEDSARTRLKEFKYGALRQEEQKKARDRSAWNPETLSEDARLVRAIEQAVRRTGFRGDPFYLAKQRDEAWTRERWEEAQRKFRRWELAQRTAAYRAATAVAGIGELVPVGEGT